MGDPGRLYFFRVERSLGTEWETVARVPYVLVVEYTEEAAPGADQKTKRPAKRRSRPKRS